MAAIKPLEIFLAENHIKRRTYYDWRDRGYAPRTIKIGRGVYIAEQDERQWVEQMRSANSVAEQRIAELILNLAEVAMELAGASSPEDAMTIMKRASVVANDLITARANRAVLAGDEADEADQHAARTRLEEVERDAFESALAADRLVKGMGKNPCPTISA